MLLNVVDPLNANKRALGAPQALGGDAGNGVALADLDQDQDLDAVVATSAGEPNQVFMNGGSGTFTPAALQDSLTDSRAVAIADINGDRLPDLTFANAGPERVYMNQGAAGFRAAASIGGNDDSRGVIVVDLFGDALPELVVANGDGNAVVYRNTAGAFSLEMPLPTGPAVSVATGDLYNDGKADLVFGRSTAAPPGLPERSRLAQYVRVERQFLPVGRARCIADIGCIARRSRSRRRCRCAGSKSQRRSDLLERRRLGRDVCVGEDADRQCRIAGRRRNQARRR